MALQRVTSQHQPQHQAAAVATVVVAAVVVVVVVVAGRGHGEEMRPRIPSALRLLWLRSEDRS